jgi:hypothetical protein
MGVTAVVTRPTQDFRLWSGAVTAVMLMVVQGGRAGKRTGMSHLPHLLCTVDTKRADPWREHEAGNDPAADPSRTRVAPA